MNDLIRMRVIGQLKRDEGLRRSAYNDSVGVPTIGYGHNLRRQISEHAAEMILEDDLTDTEGDLRRALPWAEQLSEARYGVLVNMAFNLGVGGVLGFRRMLTALKEHDYQRAGVEMLDSRWATQVGERAVRLAQQMVDDKWA